MDCPKCGSQIDADVTYCPECGLNIAELKQRAQTTATTSNRSDSSTASHAPDQAHHQSQSNTGGTTTGMADGQTTAVNRLPIQRGAVLGAAAFLANYVLTYVLLKVEFASQSAQTTNFWKFAGWALYNAHTVTIQTPYGTPFNWLENVYGGAGMTVPKLAYYAIPVVVLVGAGYYLASHTPRGTASAKAAAKAGATIIVGYAILAVIGAAIVFTMQGDAGQGATLKPALGKTALLMGVAYPGIAGALGGYLTTT